MKDIFIGPLGQNNFWVKMATIDHCGLRTPCETLNLEDVLPPSSISTSVPFGQSRKALSS